MPYARRSGDEGERDRESAGGDLSEGTLDAIPWPMEDEAECDLDGREPLNDCEYRVESWASMGEDAMPVKGGYEYDVTWGNGTDEGGDDQSVWGGYGESIMGR